MPDMPTVSPALQDKYDTYYPGQSEWRTLGAKDKARHIVCAGEFHPRPFWMLAPARERSWTPIQPGRRPPSLESVRWRARSCG